MRWIIDPTPQGALTEYYRISDPPRFWLSKQSGRYTLADGQVLVMVGTFAECDAMADSMAANPSASAESCAIRPTR